jgi:hypothetical protein
MYLIFSMSSVHSQMGDDVDCGDCDCDCDCCNDCNPCCCGSNSTSSSDHHAGSSLLICCLLADNSSHTRYDDSDDDLDGCCDPKTLYRILYYLALVTSFVSGIVLLSLHWTSLSSYWRGVGVATVALSFCLCMILPQKRNAYFCVGSLAGILCALQIAGLVTHGVFVPAIVCTCATGTLWLGLFVAFTWAVFDHAPELRVGRRRASVAGIALGHQMSSVVVVL